MITAIPLKINSIQQHGYHVMLKVKINRKTARMVLDTGASQTVMDRQRVHNFVAEREFEKNEALSTGLGTNSMESHIARIRKIQLGKLILKDASLLLLDLSLVNQSYEQLGMKPIDGIIGADILVKFRAVIDLNKKILKLTISKSQQLII